MNKIILFSSAFLLTTVANAEAFFYENSTPHTVANSIDCIDCHRATDWSEAVQPLPFLLKTNCTDCHNNDTGANFAKNSAPFAAAHHGDCLTCHENHQSRPAESLVSGSFISAAANFLDGTTSLVLSNFTANDPNWSDPNSWQEKSGPERGLILWVSYLDGTSGSFEVVESFVDSIVIKGELQGPTDNTFELVYGQMISSQVAGRSVSFSGPLTFADNDGLAGDLDGDGIADDGSPDGICQVCHLTTRYWRADGTLANHNDGTNCVDCHEHSRNFTPTAGCTSCHGYAPVASTLGGPDGLVSFPGTTGSSGSGAHALHSTSSGYNFSCSTCHFAGMPVTAVSGNNQIQMGFDILGFPGIGSGYDGQALSSPYSYEATNNTIVTTGGSMTCSTTYCHSDGTAAATGTVSSQVSPSWLGGSTSCISCHAYPPNYLQDQPKSNSHARHSQIGLSCQTCHYGTTTNGTSITNMANHVNGEYDVMPSPTFAANNQQFPLDFVYTPASGGGSCSSNSCHQYYGFSDPIRWGNITLKASPSYMQGTVSNEVNFNVTVTSCGYFAYQCAEPFTCSFDWGDGQIEQGACSTSHIYASAGNYAVTWSVWDANNHTMNPEYKTLQVTAKEVIGPPAVSISASVDPGTGIVSILTPTEASNGLAIAKIYVYWGDRRRNSYNGGGLPMEHIYAADGIYQIRVDVYDINHNKISYTFIEEPSLEVTVINP